MADVGEHYRRSRERLTDLLREVDESAWETPVAACPRWSVHDVVAHLVGVVEDALAGRLTGPPDETRTAAQVERHRGDRPEHLLERWAQLAGPFEQLISDAAVWPAAVDVHSHEHDVRAALSRPGARHDDLVLTAARQLIRDLDVEATITVDLGDETVQSKSRGEPEYRLRTTPFEVFRLRMGRRSRSQVAALDWSRSPDDVLDELFLFGPAEAPLVE